MKNKRDSVKFVVVGDGPLRASLQDEHPDLIFRGTQTGEHLARHYASADMFLFPSETETFGNVTLEAMASGLVVVAYDYAAAKLHIKHHRDRCFGSLRKFEGLRAIRPRRWCGIPRLCDRIRREARDYVSSIKWSRVVERFETLVTGTREQLSDETDSFSEGPGTMITPRGLTLAARGEALGGCLWEDFFIAQRSVWVSTQPRSIGIAGGRG